MRTSWRIFTIFGIDIRIDSSWLFIFALVTWGLAQHYFPSRYPQWSPVYSLLIGLVASLLLFSSVLAHELTHSLVARSRGEKVRSITLFLFGGVAEMTEEPKTPGKEFMIAVAGPPRAFSSPSFFSSCGTPCKGSANPSSRSPAISP